MAKIQSTQDELRYIKRNNLEQEAKVVGNYYRDIIRSFGIDCKYYRLDTTEFENFKSTIDKNVILKRAYGYNISPDYSLSASMISYMEVENDIFLLNKFGLNPNLDVNFYFDSTDFACALATKVGQYKEYKIKETEIVCEVPECNSQIKEYKDPYSGEVVESAYVSADVFPYSLGLGYNEFFECEMLKGKLSVEIPGYDLDVEQTIVCDPYEHTDFKVEFPSNEYLYKSLKHKICNDEYLQTLIYLTFTVSKVIEPTGKTKCILRGKIHGSVLFYDLNSIGKYIERIHPMVGDLITIDFPDDSNREQYEIVDCFDKQLTTDGISPLLHKYIWKCKARRYVNSYEDMEQNEANERLEAKKRFEENVDAIVQKEVSLYKDGEDAVYGGYEAVQNEYESKKVDNILTEKYEYLEDGTGIDIMKFACGSKLVTNGYDLIFVNAAGEAENITMLDHKPTVRDALFESGLKWLKSTDSFITFTNIEGHTTKIVENEVATLQELELCLDSLYDRTFDDKNINSEYDNFIKFKGSKSYIWATENNLFAKLESNKRLYKII